MTTETNETIDIPLIYKSISSSNFTCDTDPLEPSCAKFIKDMEQAHDGYKVISIETKSLPVWYGALNENLDIKYQTDVGLVKTNQNINTNQIKMSYDGSAYKKAADQWDRDDILCCVS